MTIYSVVTFSVHLIQKYLRSVATRQTLLIRRSKLETMSSQRAWKQQSLKRFRYGKASHFELPNASRKRKRTVSDNKFLQLHHLKLSGLFSPDEFLIYERREVVEMWKELDSLASHRSKFDRLNVLGPPGTGKSMVAWAWTCFNSLGNLRKNILWVHLCKGDSRIYLCHLSGGKMKTYEEGSHQFADAIKNVDADLMVIDGVTNKDYDRFSSCATSWMVKAKKGSAKRKVAIITSASVVISSENLKSAKIQEWNMPSWTLKSYVAACKNAKFYKQVKEFLPQGYKKKEDQLASKFFMAGSSARWMFSFQMQELEDEIKKQLSRVQNKEWILSDISGNNCDGAVGHLRFEDANKNVSFVSQYVMIEVAKTCELRFIRDAYIFTRQHHNPAFKGWIVEFDFLGQLHSALRHKTKLVVRKGDQELHLPVTEINYVDPDADDSNLQNLKKHAGLWLVPIRWNQGGYDAVYISGDTVNFVQITSSKRHDLKLQHMGTLFTLMCPGPTRPIAHEHTPPSIEWKSDVWFVVPWDHKCNPGARTGELSQWDGIVKRVQFRTSGPPSHATKGNNNNTHPHNNNNNNNNNNCRQLR